MNLCFQKARPLKKQTHRCFLLLSLLEPLLQSNLNTKFWGDCDITSGFGLSGSA